MRATRAGSRGPLLEHLAHRRAAEQLEDEERITVVGARIEQPDQVRMLQVRECARLGGEAPLVLHLAQHLHGDLTLEPQVAPRYTFAMPPRSISASMRYRDSRTVSVVIMSRPGAREGGARTCFVPRSER